MREEPPDQVDVEEGVQPGQLGDGGVLRRARERVLPPSGLVGRDGARVLPHARRLSEVLQRGAAEGEAGMAEPDAAPQKSGAGRIAGPKKCPHPRTAVFTLTTFMTSMDQTGACVKTRNP